MKKKIIQKLNLFIHEHNISSVNVKPFLQCTFKRSIFRSLISFSFDNIARYYIFHYNSSVLSELILQKREFTSFRNSNEHDLEFLGCRQSCQESSTEYQASNKLLESFRRKEESWVEFSPRVVHTTSLLVLLSVDALCERLRETSHSRGVKVTKQTRHKTTCETSVRKGRKKLNQCLPPAPHYHS